ncbi:MAG: hypothetical protein ACLRHW_09835 [Coprobacillus cateniformis]
MKNIKDIVDKYGQKMLLKLMKYLLSYVYIV